MIAVKIRSVLMGNLLKTTKWTGSKGRKDDRNGIKSCSVSGFRVGRPVSVG